MKFTNVFMEKTSEDAEKRLAFLRETDKYFEIKAYIIPEGDKFRVCRKVDLSFPYHEKKGFRGL